MHELVINFKKLHIKAKTPSKKDESDACWDLYSVEDIRFEPGDRYLVKTGIALEIPKGYAGFIWDRSGMAGKGMKVSGGVIDSNYRGEIMVVLQNINPPCENRFGYETVYVKAGDRIAQIHITEVNPFISFNEVPELSSSSRGSSGFGSSGK